jgi:phosphatidylserine/phosphatidylglycerophosphate/cardiolipin synthase-like enzyme
VGYLAGSTREAQPAAVAAAPVLAPAEGTIRVLYSLDTKQNDQELVALIDATQSRAYFAIYTFTLPDVANALVRAKARGVDVRGLLDRETSSTKAEKPLVAKLRAAGIPLELQTHKAGIMHIKALVTDSAYAIGSYNWTGAATNDNDEILEIGTDPQMVSTYASLLERLFTKYASGALPS